MAGGRIKGITIEIGGDATKLDKALKGVDTSLWAIQKDLKAVENQLKIDPSNTELLAQKQRLLAQAVEESAKRYEILSQAAKDSSRALSEGKIDTRQYEALNLELDLSAARLKAAKSALSDFNAELADTDSAAKGATSGIKKAGGAADDAANGFGGLGEFSRGASDALGLTDIAAGGVAFTIGQKLVESIVDCIKWMWSFDESTQELREEMGKLNTAFEAAGYTTEKAKKVYQDFYNIIGDTGTATEASQLLINMNRREDDLAQLTDILADKYGVLADSIPIDDLIAAANETVRTGEVTGALAETLESAGGSASNLEEELRSAFEALNGEGGHVDALKIIMDELSYSLLGSSDSARTASSIFQELAISENQMSRWTEIAAGVYGTFGDALPIEGLIEAANETAKTGKVTGALADALNWAGISEDKFNKILSENIDVSDRAGLIVDTLTHTYKDAADAFYKNNEAIIANRDAQSQLNEKSAELGQSVENAKTALNEAFGPGLELLLATAAGAFEELLGPIAAIGDAVQALVDGFRDAVNWLRRLIGQKSELDEHWNLVEPGKIPVENWFPEASRAVAVRTATAQELPHLAQGTVTRPNSPFLAVVGDNAQEPEIITPYSTIKRAARDAMTEGAGRGGLPAITINYTGDLAQLARILHPYITVEGQRLGPQLVY